MEKYFDFNKFELLKLTYILMDNFCPCFKLFLLEWYNLHNGAEKGGLFLETFSIDIPLETFWFTQYLWIKPMYG